MMSEVVFLVSFDAWWSSIDRRLTDHTGRGVHDVPVPMVAWLNWYLAGWRAEDVALALFPLVLDYLPGATRARGAWDDTPWQDVKQIWQRREAAAARVG